MIINVKKTDVFYVSDEKDAKSAANFRKVGRKFGVRFVRYVHSMKTPYIVAMKRALANKKNVCIFSYKARISRPLHLMSFPSDADIVILGGETKLVVEHVSKHIKKGVADHVAGFYIPRNHVQNVLKHVLEKMKNEKNGFMKAFVETQSQFNTYIPSIPCAIFGSLNNAMVQQLSITPKCLKHVPEDFYFNDDVKGLKKLALISVPVGKRWNKSMFPVMIQNYCRTSYDDDKLYWVIITTNEDDEIKKYIQSIDEDILKDPNVIFKKVEVNNDNLCANAMLNEAIKSVPEGVELIAHMSEGTYYNSNHYIQCAKMLMDNKIGCIGRTRIPCYDLKNDCGFIRNTVDINGHDVMLRQESMMYTIDFWKERQFNEQQTGNIGYAFIMDRFDQAMCVPKEIFSMLALTFNASPESATKGDNRILHFVDDDDREILNLVASTFAV